MQELVVKCARYVSTAPARPGYDAVGVGSPVGRGFVTILVTFAIVGVGFWYERSHTLAHSSAPQQLGVVAATVFTLAGVSVLYRAATTRTLSLVPAVVVLFGPGAWWCWSAFVAGQRLDPLDRPGPAAAASVIVVASSATMGFLLLAEGVATARWLGAFTGLGFVGLALVSTAVLVEPGAVTTMSLPIGATVAGMASLYGSLVEIEASERRSIGQLAKAKEQIQSEINATQELLHDLRNGLLSIEVAMGTVDCDLAGPVQSEAARLRLLTSRRRRAPEEFDLLPGLRELATTRRAAGAIIDLRLPGEARITGDQPEVMAIIDNLVANADRHGTGPIEIEVVHDAGTVAITVSDRGPASGALHHDAVFTRGYSSHPDGEGVGLSRSRMLAQANNGSLSLACNENGKTSFMLTIPAATRCESRKKASLS